MKSIIKAKFITRLIFAPVLMILANTAIAVTIEHTFQNGATADASAFNDNFKLLEQAVNNILEAKSQCVGSAPDDEMVRVGSICVDKYEASVWNSAVGGTILDNSQCRADKTKCVCDPEGQNCSINSQQAIFARSVKGVKASGNFTWFQALQACANVGKRLLTNAEWQMAAAGTQTTNCDVDSVLDVTGNNPRCFSNWGVFDMVGGLWERVGDWMQGNGDQSLWSPSTNEGLPAGVRFSVGGNYNIDDVMLGVNPATGGKNVGHFPAAILRGGSTDWGPESSGVFALLADWSPMAMTKSIGFRCAR